MNENINSLVKVQKKSNRVKWIYIIGSETWREQSVKHLICTIQYLKRQHQKLLSEQEWKRGLLSFSHQEFRPKHCSPTLYRSLLNYLNVKKGFKVLKFFIYFIVLYKWIWTLPINKITNNKLSYLSKQKPFQCLINENSSPFSTFTTSKNHKKICNLSLKLFVTQAHFHTTSQTDWDWTTRQGLLQQNLITTSYSM